MDEKQLKEQIVLPVINSANTIEVTNPEQYTGAANFLKELKEAQKKINLFFKDTIPKAHAAWKALTSQKAELLKPLTDAEATVKNNMAEYKYEQDRIAQEKQRKLQADADARARKEQERLRKKAEQYKTPEKKQEAEEAAEQVVAPIIHVESETPKESGIVYKKIWKGKVIDKEKALEAASKDLNIAVLFDVDQGKLNKIAAATKGMLNYPGIEFYEDSSIAAGSK